MTAQRKGALLADAENTSMPTDQWEFEYEERTMSTEVWKMDDIVNCSAEGDVWSSDDASRHVLAIGRDSC